MAVEGISQINAGHMIHESPMRAISPHGGADKHMGVNSTKYEFGCIDVCIESCRNYLLITMNDSSSSINYGKWTIKQLTAELKKRKAKTTGKKADLVQRLGS